MSLCRLKIHYAGYQIIQMSDLLKEYQKCMRDNVISRYDSLGHGGK
jgi:hypothetical protein